MRRILFQGKPSIKQIKHYRHPRVEAEVTPLVVIQDGTDVWGDHELQWGVVFQCIPQTLLQEAKEEDHVRAMKPFEIDEIFSAWSNPVRWWRALQLLEAPMPVLNHRNRGLMLWIATGRPDTDEQFEQKCIADLRDSMTEGYSYEEIMARSVPREIVQLSIQLFDEGLDMHNLLGDLTDEVEAGTIRWSQELKRIGASHPDYRKAVHVAKAIIVKRYRDYLFSYAAFSECSYSDDHDKKTFHMIDIEWSIYHAIEKGIETTYGMDIAAMSSILSQVIYDDDLLEDLYQKHPQEGSPPYVRPNKEERFEEVLTWMKQFSQASTLSSRENLHETLHQLYEQWETLPIVQPLVS